MTMPTGKPALLTAKVTLELGSSKRPEPFTFDVRYVDLTPGAQERHVELQRVYLLARNSRIDVTALVSGDVRSRLAVAIELQ